MARQQKTERQRAEEARAVATRKVQRLTKQRVRLAGQLAVVEDELADAKRLLDYARQHPALQSTTPTTTEENTTP